MISSQSESTAVSSPGCSFPQPNSLQCWKVINGRFTPSGTIITDTGISSYRGENAQVLFDSNTNRMNLLDEVAGVNFTIDMCDLCDITEYSHFTGYGTISSESKFETPVEFHACFQKCGLTDMNHSANSYLQYTIRIDCTEVPYFWCLIRIL